MSLKGISFRRICNPPELNIRIYNALCLLSDFVLRKSCLYKLVLSRCFSDYEILIFSASGFQIPTSKGAAGKQHKAIPAEKRQERSLRG